MTPYQAHIEKWKHCDRCILHSQRNRVVFAKGKIPCDVLFVGEAPGDAENVSGVPFDGPAGIKLDEIIADVLYNLSYQTPNYPRLAFYNLVSCFPAEAKKTNNHEPPVDAVKACYLKLREFVRIARPKLIVMVGQLARKNIIGQNDFATPQEERDGQLSWIPRGKFLEFCDIVHPAAILRAPQAQQSLMVKQSIVRLVSAVPKSLNL